MPLLKRSHQATQSGGIVEVQEARSSFTNEGQPRKRVRVSIDGNHQIPGRDSEPVAPRRGEESSSDSENEDDGDYPDSPPQTQYEMMRDNGFKHLENTEYDDQQATQKILQRSTSRVLDNMVAESGIIESITCNNFMCHERLHVELGPLINFIVGENGSGKSAVLTALTLCLGGKASDTNRGGSLKSFVKEGRDTGSLVVKIKNAGSDSYKPDVYGRSIIVERTFSKSGNSGFKIKSEHGRIISTKKQEVEEISEWYALQIGNPLTVLSQDNARQFLNAATPAQKYKYFVAGVQLEQLDNDYKMSQDTLDKTLNLRDDLNEKIAAVKREMEQAEKLAETAQKNQSLREKARHYRNQLVWSQVVEQERDLERRNVDLIKRAEELSELARECDIMANAFSEMEEKLARVVETRERLDHREGDEELAEAEASLNDIKRKQADLQREERDAFSRLKTLRSTIQACETKIEDEERLLGEATGAARTQKEDELAKATAQSKDIAGKLKESQEKSLSFDASCREAEKNAATASESVGRKRHDVLAVEKAVSELENSKGSAYDGFDKDLIRLADAVKKDTGFEHKPLGPLATHVRLRKPEWSTIIEKTLGEGLNAFVVRSKRDQSRLSGLIRQLGMRKSPPIFIAYGGRIDTSSQEPDPSFDTILRVLEFDDELIRSQLIINGQIEKIILVKERTEAERIMIDNDGPPRNVAACLCFHDGRGKRGHGLRITNRNGTIGTAPVTPSGLKPRMQSDMGRQLAIQQENLKQVGLEYKELAGEERLAKQEVQRRKSERDNHFRHIKTLTRELREKEADIEKLSIELDGFEGVDTRLITLREERETKRVEEEQLGLQYGNIKLEKHELQEKVTLAKKRYDEQKDEQRDFQSKISKMDEKIKSHESMRRIALAKKNTAIERLEIQQSERVRAQDRRDQKQTEVEEFIQEAQKVASHRVHIPEDETYQSIEKKYQKVGEQLAMREAKQGASDQAIYERAAEARARYEDVMQKTKDVDITIRSLKQSIEHRLHLWRTFQRQISARIRIQFNYLLSERGFRGQIDLDHKARKVNIQIEPDKTRKNATGRNTKTLSGGEKSFSSICMLLSVWEAIGSPIRCLDEFDVFMDNVNRAISTNMLVDAARRSVSRQYILITPNAIEGRARLDKDVKVIRLTDPRQRTLI